MTDVELQDATLQELSPGKILAQLELLTKDDVFRSSKRSVEFLKYVVNATLEGAADQIKERTIGIEVFDRSFSYDTNLDHVVRTAATELRKRLAIYYGAEKHRSELRIDLIPGSYVPKFSTPHTGPAEPSTSDETLAAMRLHGTITSPSNAAPPKSKLWVLFLAAAALILACGLGYAWMHRATPQDLFWKPVLDTQGPVVLAVGEVPDGPPTLPLTDDAQNPAPPLLHADSSTSVPFADAMTIARVVGVLQSNGKKVLIRRENASSFSDLREGPVVLIGAFNNEWSLRLTRQLRYTLALDSEKHLIYIKDAQNPSSRSWSWATNQSREYKGGVGSPVLHDYALISRIRSPETGHVVVVIGGLYVYGTQSAGEFLNDPQLMQSIAKTLQSDPGSKNLQIVLGTTITDGTPGPPTVLAITTD
jgi:hypothetical protein